MKNHIKKYVSINTHNGCWVVPIHPRVKPYETIKLAGRAKNHSEAAPVTVSKVAHPGARAEGHELYFCPCLKLLHSYFPFSPS